MEHPFKHGHDKPLGITEVVLRDGHQSLLATRMRIEDMLPIAAKLDQAGFWAIESWGGATFDACIRFLGEDPWERIRRFKEAMPNTRQQMLFRSQTILGYRHYADDVVRKFVEQVEHVTFSGAYARQRGQDVTVVTERCVLTLTLEGWVLVEIAPGVDIQHDVMAHCGFPLHVSPHLRTMDAALFDPAPLQLSFA